MNQSFKFYPKPGGVKATTLVGLFLLLISGLTGLAGPVLAQDVGHISGRVYSDLNINNVLNIGEEGLAGWPVNLLADGKIIKSTSAGSSGGYYFSDLAGGDYQIQIEAPKNWAAVGNNPTAVILRTGKSIQANLGFYQLDRIEEKTLPPLMSIHTYSVKKLSPTSVKVIWFTNYLATGQVVFGRSQAGGNHSFFSKNNFGYQSSTAVDFGVKTYHEMVLKDLQPGAVYFCRLVSLPDPRQWRGAANIVSPEIIFITDFAGSLGAGGTAGQTGGWAGNLKGTVKGSQTGDGKGGLAYPGKVLSTEITPAELADVEEAMIEADVAKQEAKPDENKTPPAPCAYYIWLLLFLNLICAAVAWQRGKNNESPLIRNMWWILLLLAAGPAIFYYPSCRVAIWLFVLLAVNFSYISGFKKKPRPPDEAGPPPSPFDNFDDDNIISSG